MLNKQYHLILLLFVSLFLLLVGLSASFWPRDTRLSASDFVGLGYTDSVADIR